MITCQHDYMPSTASAELFRHGGKSDSDPPKKHGLYSHGLSSYGQWDSDTPKKHGLYSYGLSSYGQWDSDTPKNMSYVFVAYLVMAKGF